MKAVYNTEYHMRRAIIGFMLLLFLPVFVHAADFSATPLVIDGKGKAREILKFSLALKNDSNNLLTIYPWVTNFTSASGTASMPDLSRADLSQSLANWIEMTRGVVDILPGEKRDIPIMIQLNVNARPGIYHAELRFAHGSSRIEAETNREVLIIPVNIEVLDDITEKLQLSKFVPERQWFLGDSAAFTYRLENVGNRGVAPQGKIRIFDRRGAEVAAIDANANGEKLEPAAAAMLSAVWAADGHFGKYKAMLDIEYGQHGRGMVQDTIFFWVVPWQKIFGMFATILIISIIAAVLLHSRSKAGLAYARAKHERVTYETRDTVDEVNPYLEALKQVDRKQAPVYMASHATPHRGGQVVLTQEEHAPTITPTRITERPKVTPDPRHVVRLK